MDVLKALEASKITLEVLTKTKIGMIVNNFRKSSNSTPESVALSKQLIKNWKRLLPSGKVKNIFMSMKFVKLSSILNFIS